jgi:hypothetical protein
MFCVGATTVYDFRNSPIDTLMKGTAPRKAASFLNAVSTTTDSGPTRRGGDSRADELF